MRSRLRDMPTQDELDVLYAQPHDHRKWVDHQIRCDVSISMAMHLSLGPKTYVADLSCGNGYIASSIATLKEMVPILGDFAPGYRYQGPIEETIQQVPQGIELFVCSETIEHLDKPDEVLEAIRTKSDMLLLSTPEGEENADNPEHIWSWESEDVQDMLQQAGWTPMIHTVLDLRPSGFVYAYQIWVCS